MTNQTYQRDGNFVPITNLGLQQSKSITFVAGTTGAIGTTTLFTVTGTVSINLWAICTTDVTGTGSLTVGVAGSTAALCSTQTASSITAHKVWQGSSLAIAANVGLNQYITDQSVIQTIASNTATAGVVTYYCTWIPITADGNVVAA